MVSCMIICGNRFGLKTILISLADEYGVLQSKNEGGGGVGGRYEDFKRCKFFFGTCKVGFFSSLGIYFVWPEYIFFINSVLGKMFWLAFAKSLLNLSLIVSSLKLSQFNKRLLISHFLFQARPSLF